MDIRKVLVSTFSTINLQLLPVKIHYFIFISALGCVLPFRTVFAKQQGLSSVATGIIFIAAPLAKICFNPLLGGLVDYYKKFRITVIILIILTALLNILMTFIPARVSITEQELKFHLNFNCDNFTLIAFPTKNTTANLSINNTCEFQCTVCNNFQCKENCLNSTVRIKTNFVKIDDDNKLEINITSLVSNNLTYLSFESFYHNKDSCVCYSFMNCSSSTCSVNNHDKNVIISKPINEFYTIQFWLFLLCITFSSPIFMGVIFLMDAVCYEILNDKPHKYGQQRLWSTVGWGIGTLVGGYVNDLQMGDSEVRNYTACFYLAAVLCIIDIIPVTYTKVGNLKYSSNIFKDVGHLLCHAYVRTYVIMAYFVGVLSGFIWNYQFWFLEEIGATSLLMGLSMTAECLLAELPCFLIAGWIIKKIGHNNCTSVTFCFLGLKYFAFAFMKNPWLSIPAGLLHGPTFGIFYAALTSFGKLHAPPGTEATVQALLSVAFEGAGASTGVLVGGISFENLGSRASFQLAGIACFVFLFINIIFQLLCKYTKDSQDKRTEAQLSTCTAE